ncbi:MAG: hypothetical protein GWM98_18905 [Nitrospinaceae bacterium]|nr:hypothetical protein [Nitrospinaceae bacterium]NIR56173.1 hypothetical protein [Nitrospinaceae bacterium]NIS86629.1 hypothetical protein [Nitrospinaceae bacterium]NIT83462.1 hypothetical protein [Nitrospinaceae bacterium]NIU45667.1 hypothetical protein [Nitrospinaceae bacterium]
MTLFGWDIPYYLITAVLFGLFLLAFAVSPFSAFWERVLFKSAVSGFWALVLLWAVSSLIFFANQ